MPPKKARRSPASATSTTAALSLVVPVYNEARHLRDWCLALAKHRFEFTTEIVFVDDCSTDGSRDILREQCAEHGWKLVCQEKNVGKGAAVARGISETTGLIVMIQDADFEYSLGDIETVVRPIMEDKADVVFGSRYKSSQTVHRTFHYAINRFLTLTSNIVSGLYLTDMETCYKAMRGDIARGLRLESPRFGIEPELTAKIAILRVRVAEVPISYFPRSYLEGKKIKWTDGVAALWHIVRFNAKLLRDDGTTSGVPEQYRMSGRRWL